MSRGAWTCAVTLLAFGCADPHPSVLLITCDTLRPDHLGIYGYPRPTSPNIDRIFADAAIFERAYATEASTPPSVVSVLSGLYPQEHGVRVFYQLIDEDVALLPELLPDDYQTAAFVSNVVLTDEAAGMAGRFDHYDDYVDEREPNRPIYERRAERTTDAAIAWLESARDEDRPLFLWIHYIDPHGPYAAPANRRVGFDHEGRRLLEKGRMLPFQVDPEVTDALDYVDRYDEEIAYMDAELGRLVDAYAAMLGLDDTLLLFTADHGETMIEHETWFTHGYHVYEPIIRVPLMLRGPGLRPGRRGDVVSLIDVVPTVLRSTGSPRSGSLPGRPLHEGAPDEDRLVFAEAFRQGRSWRAGIRGSDKWTFLMLPVGLDPGMHLDLAQDRAEARPRPWEEGVRPPEILLERARLDPDRVTLRGGAGKPLDAPKVDPRATADQLEKLRALGYVTD